MTDVARLLEQRFGETVAEPETGHPASATIEALARRCSCRRFESKDVDEALIRFLCAVALCAPTKSDLQQRDIVIVADVALKAELVALLDGQEWMRAAPSLLVFCGNNNRQRLLHAWRGHAFANDHLDAFFNAAVDAGIALAAFMIAAESIGLGCCPLSAIRNHADEVATLLALPDHVFPVVGLALGWPAEAPPISMRLPLSVTVHADRFRQRELRQAVDAYDRRRAAAQPYERQRFTADYGHDPVYGWSEDKARQYSKPERAGFGAFVRKIGFKLT